MTIFLLLLMFYFTYIIINIVFVICNDVSLRSLIVHMIIFITMVLAIFSTLDKKLILTQKIISLENICVNNKIYYIVTTKDDKLILNNIEYISNGKMELNLYKIDCIFGELTKQYIINE